MFDVIVCGSLNVDLVARVAHLPRPGETVPGHSLQRLPGGKGLNQAIAAARLGARTALIGACGDDVEATWLLDRLAHEQVDVTRVLTRAHEHTGLAHVMVADDGENAIVVHGAANRTLAPEEIRASIVAARVVLAQLETPPNAVAEFLNAARASGARTLLNTAPAVPDARHLLALADIVILNETELAQYAALHAGSKCDDDSIDAHAKRARMLALHTVIVTLGARGALVVTHDRVVHHPAPQVTVVDTTGAGDCFCGALAAAMARGASLHDATTFAVRAASLAVTRVGAAPAMPKREELESPE